MIYLTVQRLTGIVVCFLRIKNPRLSVVLACAVLRVFNLFGRDMAILHTSHSGSQSGAYLGSREGQEGWREDQRT